MQYFGGIYQNTSLKSGGIYIGQIIAIMVHDSCFHWITPEVAIHIGYVPIGNNGYIGERDVISPWILIGKIFIFPLCFVVLMAVALKMIVADVLMKPITIVESAMFRCNEPDSSHKKMGSDTRTSSVVKIGDP